MVALRIIAILAATCAAAVLVSGCASTQLNENTLDLAESTDNLLTKQVKYNLAQFIDSQMAIPAQRGGPGCLNRFSASISGASARVRLPSGVAAG